ncbi:hypothetical protein [Xanthomonas arboricola]|uniref:hypothetical protein n=1 Tax=Xanthomonas arboricola TaxID=56448 RepID=UPI00155840FB|nr:hypothetical protein [Xanthomonas arboricola]
MSRSKNELIREPYFQVVGNAVELQAAPEQRFQKTIGDVSISDVPASDVAL